MPYDFLLGVAVGWFANRLLGRFLSLYYHARRVVKRPF